MLTCEVHPFQACFDVRESSVFWNKMSLHGMLTDGEQANIELPQWLSTHPNNENRAQTLDTLIPEVRYFEECCCALYFQCRVKMILLNILPQRSVAREAVAKPLCSACV